MGQLTNYPSNVQRIELCNRVENFNESGGGSIVRTIYVEPFSSHPTVLAALKGTVRAAASGLWERVLPHNDPLFPWFYCSDAQAFPLHAGAVRGMPSTQFDVNNPDQIEEAQNALDCVDDFDGASLIDNLTPTQIQAGGVAPTSKEVWESTGSCGCYIVATYAPLVSCVHDTAGNYGGDGSGFDYVNPTWTPLTKVTQLGRDLKFIAPIDPSVPLVGGSIGYCGGVSDTAGIVEQMWELKITRRLVPFLPTKTFSLLQSKINAGEFIIGGQNNNATIVLPPGTVRMETPKPVMGIAPDGATYWDIDLIFTVRMLWSDYYEMDALVNGNIQPMTQATGYVGWNYQYGIPALPILGLPINTPGYYPVGWKTQYPWTSDVGSFRLLHLEDEDIPANQAPNGSGPAPQSETGIMALTVDPFNRGFMANQ